VCWGDHLSGPLFSYAQLHQRAGAPLSGSTCQVVPQGRGADSYYSSVRPRPPTTTCHVRWGGHLSGPFVFVRPATSKGGCAPVRDHLSGSPTRDGGCGLPLFISKATPPVTRPVTSRATAPGLRAIRHAHVINHSSHFTRHAIIQVRSAPRHAFLIIYVDERRAYILCYNDEANIK